MPSGWLTNQELEEQQRMLEEYEKECHEQMLANAARLRFTRDEAERLERISWAAGSLNHNWFWGVRATHQSDEGRQYCMKVVRSQLQMLKQELADMLMEDGEAND